MFSAQAEAVASQTGGVDSGGAADSGGATSEPIPHPEVPAKPKRRQFTAEYKRAILDEAEACRDGCVANVQTPEQRPACLPELGSIGESEQS